MSAAIVTLPNPDTLRDEWFIAPILLSNDGPREWFKSEYEAVEAAKTYAQWHNFSYEVYKRTHFISIADIGEDWIKK